MNRSFRCATPRGPVLNNASRAGPDQRVKGVDPILLLDLTDATGEVSQKPESPDAVCLVVQL
jgi:hypothetical protein